MRSQRKKRITRDRVPIAYSSDQEGHWDWDLANDTVFYSSRWLKMLGCTRKELEPRISAFETLLHPDDLDKVRLAFDNLRNGGQDYVMEYRLRHHDGRYLEVFSKFFAIRGVLGGPVSRIVGTGLDLSAIRRAEEKYEEGMERYRAFFEQAADSIVMFDPQTLTFVDFNDEACRRLGYTRDEFAKLDISDIEVMESFNETRHHSKRVVQIGREVFETRHRAKNGDILDVEVRTSRIQCGDKTLIQGIWRDITEQKHLEKELCNLTDHLERRVEERTRELRESEEKYRALANERDEKTRQLERLAVRVAHAHEDERRRIARGLHDEVGQLLAATQLKLGMASGTVPPGRRKALLKSADDLISTAIQEIRELTFELSTPTLFEIGFKEAVEELCEHMTRKFHIKFSLEDQAGGFVVDMNMRSTLYHAVRELLFNVVKHAGAHRSVVRFTREDGTIMITVEDDGKGFNSLDAGRAVTRAGGFGLYHIRERLRDIQGELSVQSVIGDGTRARIVLPSDLEREGHEKEDQGPIG